MDDEKVITFNRTDFSQEAWETICDEFEVDYDKEEIMCVADLATIDC